jgi:hypothetical protein
VVEHGFGIGIGIGIGSFIVLDVERVCISRLSVAWTLYLDPIRQI